MKTKKIIRFILFVPLTFTCFLSQAQNDCAQTLILAERVYYQGRFGDVQPLLENCIRDGFDKDQKTEAYKLLSLSAIYTKNFKLADSTLLLMLKTNPQYEFAPQDPSEFKSRVAKFKIHPIIEATFNMGLVQPFFHIDEVFDARVRPATTTYTGKTGSQFGLSIAYYINNRISFRGGFERLAYSFTVEDKNDLNTALLTESESRNQLQAAAGYRFKLYKLNLQIYGGIVYSTLTKADSYLVFNRVSGSGEIDFSYSNLDQRNLHEIRPLLELKLNVPQKNGWTVSTSLRYEHGLGNMTDPDGRYNNLTHASLFEWVEDDFKGRYLSVSIGISKLFYRVK